MLSSPISPILESISALGEPIHVHGASESARALIVYRYALRFKPPILVIFCPDDDKAGELATDLEFFCAMGEPYG